MRHALTLTSAFLLALTSGQVRAQMPDHQIAVEQPWARATPRGVKTGATYMTLINKSNSTDQLLGATTPVAERIQFHQETEENGVARMRELHAVEIAPGARVTFRPGDMHMMMVRLKQPLVEGQTFPLTLDFEKAGKVDVMVPVARAGAMEHGDTSPMTHDAVTR